MGNIITGAMKWGSWGANYNMEEARELILICVEHGLNIFDHADIYGGYTTEALWGEAFAKCGLGRTEITVISKCGIIMPCEGRPEYTLKMYDASKSHIIESAKRSVDNLQCDYLDQLLFHRPSPLMDIEAIGEAVESLKQEGIIKSFGVSNFTPSQIDLLQSKVKVEVNQIEISFLHLDPFLNGIIDYCYAQGIEIQAWSPLGGGNLFGESADYEFVTRRARLKEVADKYEWGLDEMAYLFLLHHPASISPVVGTSKIDRLIKAKKMESLSITDHQWFEIWTASQGQEVP